MTAPSIATDQNLRGLSSNNDKTPDSVSVPWLSVNPAKNRLPSKFIAKPVTLRWATAAGASAAPSNVQINPPSEFSRYSFPVDEPITRREASPFIVTWLTVAPASPIT
jgi:hypothetical protein